MRERPRSRRAAEQRDELAPPHAQHRAFLPLAKSRRRWLPTGEGPSRIMRVAHWEQHSVRGFFAGVMRKKLGLDLRSEKVDGTRLFPLLIAMPRLSAGPPTPSGQEVPAPVCAK